MPSTSGATPDSITEGDLVRPLLRLAWPMVVIQLLQVAYNLADTFWLGRLSADAVGAMSIAFPLIFFMLSIGGGFTTAGSILVAQYTGAEREDGAGMVAGQTLSFVTLLAIALGGLGFLATGGMLDLLPADPETARDVIPLAADYMRIFFLGTPFLFGFFIFSSLMRGYGNTKVPMRVMFLSVAINVVLDPVLIFGWWVFPDLGIQGAALATIISRGIASVVGVYILFYTTAGPDVDLHHLVPDLDLIEQIVRIGVPSALEQSASATAMIVLTAIVSSFPPAVVAAFGLGNRLISLVFLPAMGIGRATNTMVGQNLGAEKPERAERAVWLAVTVSGSVMLAVGIIAALSPSTFISIFIPATTPDAIETIRLGSDYLRIRSIEFLFIGVLQVILGAFRGSGNTKTAMTFSIVTLWLGRVPTVYALAFIVGLGATGIWIGMALGNIVGAIVATAWFTRGTWKQAIIDSDDPTPGLDVPDIADE